MRQDAGAVQVEFVVDDHVFPQHGNVLHPNLREPHGIVGKAAAASPTRMEVLTHWPTEELQPTMQLSNQEWQRTRDPLSTVQRFILTPSSTTTPAPMVTLGPMVQFIPIFAVGSCRGET